MTSTDIFLIIFLSIIFIVPIFLTLGVILVDKYRGKKWKKEITTNKNLRLLIIFRDESYNRYRKIEHECSNYRLKIDTLRNPEKHSYLTTEEIAKQLSEADKLAEEYKFIHTQEMNLYKQWNLACEQVLTFCKNHNIRYWE